MKQNDKQRVLTGPAGDIELVYRCVEDAEAVAIICHPHPLHGGTLHNKVVHMLASGFNELGAHSVRFNFRGVGQSEGEFAQGIGETEDLLTVVDWVREHFPDIPLWLAGFSFGAYVAYRSAAQIQPERLVLVAPPVSLFEFADIPEPDMPWMVIQGCEDEIVSAEAVTLWARQRPHPPQLFLHEDTGHFFHGKLKLLQESLKSGIPSQ